MLQSIEPFGHSWTYNWFNWYNMDKQGALAFAPKTTGVVIGLWALAVIAVFDFSAQQLAPPSHDVEEKGMSSSFGVNFSQTFV